jgi:hypothetical protein
VAPKAGGLLELLGLDELPPPLPESELAAGAATADAPEGAGGDALGLDV